MKIKHLYQPIKGKVLPRRPKTLVPWRKIEGINFLQNRLAGLKH